MIVVVGPVFARGLSPDAEPDGLAATLARTAATAGARVEVVSRIGDDPAGDAVLLRFAALGIGHVATLRDPARWTRIIAEERDVPDPAAADDDGARTPAEATGQPEPTLDAGDVGLALRYLSDYRVVVVVHPTGAVLAEAVAAATYASAHLVVVTDADPTASLPDDAVVFVAAPDSTAIGFPLGRYVAAVDAGEPPESTFAATFGAL